jgi:hypothetical protein
MVFCFGEPWAERPDSLHVFGPVKRGSAIRDRIVIRVEDGDLAPLVEARVRNVDTCLLLANEAPSTTDLIADLELLSGGQLDDERLGPCYRGPARPYDGEPVAVLIEEHAPIRNRQGTHDLSVHATRRQHRATMDEEPHIVVTDTPFMNPAAAGKEHEQQQQRHGGQAGSIPRIPQPYVGAHRHATKRVTTPVIFARLRRGPVSRCSHAARPTRWADR